MSRKFQIALAFALAAITSTGAFGQTPMPDRYMVTNCVKVKDGKQAEYAAYLKDSVTKLYRSRVDAGEVATYLISSAVAPAGAAARCDYRHSTVYNGIPAEPGAANLESSLKKAGISMTAAEMTAKRDSLVTLASRDVWRIRETIGSVVKGGYIRVNYYQVHAGMAADFIAKETSGWKPFAEEMNKHDGGRTWSLLSLVMPAGSHVAYNAATVDGFPSWAAMMTPMSIRPTWNKVHPTIDSSAYLSQINSLADRAYIDVLKVVDVIRK